jgi:CheY-like chemotaxis protein
MGEERSLKILLVDDDDEVRAMVSLALEWRGHKVVTAASGPEAEKCLQHHFFDVVVSDLIMPEMDGLELMRIARALHPQTRIIMMSGGGVYLPAKEGLLLARQLGADAIIMKPFTPAELLELIVATIA